MFRLFKRTRDVVVHFCERCGRVSASACSRDAVRTKALAAGVRFL